MVFRPSTSAELFIALEACAGGPKGSLPEDGNGNSSWTIEPSPQWAAWTGVSCVGGTEGTPLDAWDVSGITNFRASFAGAEAFVANLDAWNVSQATSLAQMFAMAYSFAGDLASWSTGAVETTSGMFKNAKAFNGNLEAWDVSQVTDFSQMFQGCKSFAGDISLWNVERANTFESMFAYTKAFDCNISKWNTWSVQNMSRMMKAAIFNQPIGTWDVSRVIRMTGMFMRNAHFNQDLRAWNTSKVKNMDNMFANATEFHHDIRGWSNSSLESSQDMFAGATRFLKYYKAPLTAVNAGTATDGPPGVWSALLCDASTPPPGGRIGTCNDTIPLGSECFPACAARYIMAAPARCTLDGILEPSKCIFNSTKKYLFPKSGKYLSKAVQACLEQDPAMEIHGCGTALMHLDDKMNPITVHVREHYGEMWNWDVSKVEDFSFSTSGEPMGIFENNLPAKDTSMFKGIGLGDLSRWNPVGATRMQRVFFGATSFHGNVSGWNLAMNVTTDNMFAGATAFLSSFDCFNALNGPPSSCAAVPTCSTANVSTWPAMQGSCPTFLKRNQSCRIPCAGGYTTFGRALTCSANATLDVPSCVICPAGYFCNRESVLAPELCNETIADAQLTCPEGSTNGSVICPVGHFCDNAASAPQACSDIDASTGRQVYCPAGSQHPALCPGGFTCSSSDIAPEPCSSGTYCPQGSAYAIPCDELDADGRAQECPPQSTTPMLCPAGRYCTEVTGSNICPQYFYCPEGTALPLRCPLCPRGSSAYISELDTLPALAPYQPGDHMYVEHGIVFLCDAREVPLTSTAIQALEGALALVVGVRPETISVVCTCKSVCKPTCDQDQEGRPSPEAPIPKDNFAIGTTHGRRALARSNQDASALAPTTPPPPWVAKYQIDVSGQTQGDAVVQYLKSDVFLEDLWRQLLDEIAFPVDALETRMEAAFQPIVLWIPILTNVSSDIPPSDNPDGGGKTTNGNASTRKRDFALSGEGQVVPAAQLTLLLSAAILYLTV